MARNPLGRGLFRKIADGITDFGSVVSKSVNVDVAARAMGTTKKVVRQVLQERHTQIRSTLFTGMTGRKDADVSGKGDPASLKGALLAAYGPGKRTEIDTRAAAQDLGVSIRTVQRWLAPEGKQRISAPKPETMGKIATRARQAATTQAGRRSAVGSFRTSSAGSGLLKRGGYINIDGVQGPSSYERDRAITLELTPEQADALLTAYEQGGDKAALSIINGHANNYVAGWSVLDLSDVKMSSRKGP